MNKNLHAVLEACCAFASVIDSDIGADCVCGTVMSSKSAFVHIWNKRACFSVALVELVAFAPVVFVQISAGCVRITRVGITLVGGIDSCPFAACDISEYFPRSVQWGTRFVGCYSVKITVSTGQRPGRLSKACPNSFKGIYGDSRNYLSWN